MAVVMVVAVRAAVVRVAARAVDDMLVARAVVAAVRVAWHLDRAAVGCLLEVPG